MTRSTLDYFERRAQEEERLAAASTHPAVRTTHERFAEAYREQAGSQQLMYGRSRQQPDVHADG